MSRHSRIYALVVLAAVLLGAAYCLVADRGFFVEMFSDDAYYYFKTAHNITHGRGVTFDGVNPTNGFHPLWMAVLLPVFGLLDGNPVAPLRAVAILQFVLYGLAAWWAWRLLLRRFGPAAAWTACAALLLPPIQNFFFSGLESALSLAGILLFADLADERGWLRLDAGAGRDLACGAMLAAVSLARLDSAFLAVGANLAFLLVGLFRGPAAFAGAVRKALRITAAYAVVIAPYLAWNLVEFGHLMPVSSMLKTAFPAVAGDLRRLLYPQRLMYLGAGAGMILLAAVGLLARLRSLREAFLPADGGGAQAGLPLALTLTVGLHFLNTVLFMDWAVYWWHFLLYVPLVLFWVAFLAGALQGRFRARILRWGLAALVAAAGFAATAVEQSFKGSFHDNWLEVAEWTRDNTPADMVLGMRDCGLFTWFCGRDVVNLDGVINGFGFQDAVRQGRLADYLRACGVDALATHNVAYRDGAFDFRVESRLGRPVRRFAVRLQPEDEIHRTEPRAWVASFRRGGAPRRLFVIWSLDRGDLSSRVREL